MSFFASLKVFKTWKLGASQPYLEEGYIQKTRQRSLRLFGGRFFQFLATLAVLPWSIWKKRSNSSYFSKSTEAKQLARQGIEQILPPKQTRRPLPCLLILSFFYGCVVYRRSSLFRSAIPQDQKISGITLGLCESESQMPSLVN